VETVEAAIASGYRLVDTAAAYGNEREVGESIRRSGINRGDMFITVNLSVFRHIRVGRQHLVPNCKRA